jgi:hypothetical protein
MNGLRTILAAMVGLAFGELCGLGLYMMAKAADAGVYNWYSGDWLGNLSLFGAVFGSFVLIPVCVAIIAVMATSRYKRE